MSEQALHVRLVVDEGSGKVFLVVQEFTRVLRAIDVYGSLEIVDDGQGTVRVLAAETNVDRRGGYTVAACRPIPMKGSGSSLV